MKLNQKLSAFPLGSIVAEGFMKEQLLRCKDGIGGHLDEIEPEMIATPYINLTRVTQWEGSEEHQNGWTAEISGNYWTGLIQLAFTLNDDELKEKATNWVNGTIKNQREDGYLGTFGENANRLHPFNAACLWAYRALLLFYEATGREDVFEAVRRAMLWFANNWSGHLEEINSCYSSVKLIGHSAEMSCIFDEPAMLEFAHEYNQYLSEHDNFLISHNALISDKFEYNSDHTANYATAVRIPAMLYMANGKPEYLEASRRGIEKMRKYCGLLNGGVASHGEFLAPVKGTADTEYCAMTNLNLSYSYMGRITGEALYGDYMEEVFYNAAQGARKKDERAIAYNSAPNQIYANSVSDDAGTPCHLYAPCFTTSCCPVNAVVLPPEFVRNMMFHDDEQNIYVNAYGPCTLNWNGVRIEERTLYPFRDTVNFTVHAKRAFSVFLKIPVWCKNYELILNENVISAEVSLGYAKVYNSWNPGDTLSIRFEMETEVIHVNDLDGSAKFPIAIRRGVLLYSYHIPEVWSIYNAKRAKHTDEWPWFSVKPMYMDPVHNSYSSESLGVRRWFASWNIALDEKLSPKSIRVEEVDNNGYVWENAPIKLHTEAYRAPFVWPVRTSRNTEPLKAKATVDKKIELELVPYGCTNLRITYFPRADLENR